MKSLHINNFNIEFPDEWNVDDNGRVISIYNANNGVGAIQLSCYKVLNSESILLDKELDEYLKERNSVIKIELINGYAYCTFIDKKSLYWRYWLLKNENAVLFISYNCELDDRKVEYGVVNRIVESIL